MCEWATIPSRACFVNHRRLCRFSATTTEGIRRGPASLYLVFVTTRGDIFGRYIRANIACRPLRPPAKSEVHRSVIDAPTRRSHSWDPGMVYMDASRAILIAACPRLSAATIVVDSGTNICSRVWSGLSPLLAGSAWTLSAAAGLQWFCTRKIKYDRCCCCCCC